MTTVVRGRTPAFGRADVLRGIDGCFDRCDERVLHATQPDWIAAPHLVGVSLPFEHGYVFGHAAEQSQDTGLIDHVSHRRR